MSKRRYQLALAFSVFTYNTGAWATTFNLESTGPGRDPSENFDEECLGDTGLGDTGPSHTALDNCDVRAAVMEAELLSTLITLEWDDSPETVSLFQSALNIDSPQIQAFALQYLSRLEVTEDVFSAARSFLFGTEPRRGATAAQLISNSADNSTEAQLAKLYKEQRPLSAYEPRSESYADPGLEPLVIACSNDARLNQVASFTAEEQFEPAERCLVYDRFVVERLDIKTDYPVTAFVTDASVEDVIDHFTLVFGQNPYPTTLESQTALQNASVEIAGLQSAILSGDMAAIKKLQAISEQLQEAQAALSLSGSLQLQAVHADKDVFWVNAELAKAAQSPMPRAVSVGADALLGKTVIRYFNGNVNGILTPPNNGGTADAGVPTPGTGSSSSGGSPNVDGVTDAGGAGVPGNNGTSNAGSSKKSSSCSVATPGQAQASLCYFVLAGVALIRRRKLIAPRRRA